MSAPGRGRKRKLLTRQPEETVANVVDETERFASLELDDSGSEAPSVASGSASEVEIEGEDEEDSDNEGESNGKVTGLIEEELRALKPTRASRSRRNAAGANGEDEEASDDDAEDSDEAGFEQVDENDLELNYTVSTDANGNPRYIYKEIEPGYETDDSDAPDNENTIGDIPLTFYDAYPHIGYDINGKKIMRPAKGDALDTLLNSIELPEGWTGLTDPATGKPLELTQEELEMLKKITRNEIPEEGYDPYPEMFDYFSRQTEIMPLSAAPEPKRRFVPSKHEAKKVMKIVKAIREGRIQPYRPPEETEEEETDPWTFDVWADEKPRPDHPMNVPAPKLPPPGYEESVHPPPEYLPDQEEKDTWLAQDPEEREKEFLPSDYDALHKVPGYDRFVKERFERSLDLYLAPRVRRSKLDIDPESLLPKLPNPEELRPYPTTCAAVFSGHEGRVRSIAVDPTGTILASGADDGTVRLWELLTGRQLQRIRIGDEPINAVRWRPGRDALILAAASGNEVYFVIPLTIPNMTPAVESASRTVLDMGFGHATGKGDTNSASQKIPGSTWSRPGSKLEEQGVLLKIVVRATVKVICFHRRGEYFATVAPSGQSHAVAIHTLSQHRTQLPFRKLKGLPQTATFHPSKPLFFVATQRSVRIYDLSRQQLVKSLQPGAKWISSIDLHPGGDNLIVGAYDKRMMWHDLELSIHPYRTLRFHTKAVRAVKVHPGGLPLFVDASDDGTCQVYHGRVVDDLMENATIVPLKTLRGHKVTSQLGVLDVDWHPRNPWCVTAGADGTCRLWT
ncbi:putative ribosome biogenesis protein Erb1 [Eremomyces bilateralis CBS 781.70]|uniref:Ribosome biogenesis protein ERB1 n=1 Tax=Eremomyces bilateralis CBS 781.70 TaxID=1392243 RepID=A0A6G1GG90_9PEZI|nr:putative ribosome biogenesis protein Erb1 [Eremomyces bilateralis CBS 781.70]KAF1816946.1 putative ribosome biogenesis protein Erb1 [Eremomyces bilateralis CBS 781.70]